MTTQVTTTKSDIAPAGPAPAAPFVRFPDHQPSEETVTIYNHLFYPALPAAVGRHLGNAETTLVTSEFAAGLFPTASREGLRYPDLLIAFDVDPKAFEARNGYLIPEQGKPPDFILEVASASTGREDEGAKRADYESMGVLEYWRFDHTGGEYHSVPLAGDRLVEGRYRPIEIVQVSDGIYRGHSEVLNLDLCWEYGILRWYDPVGGRYLRTYDETDDERIAEAQRADAEAQRADTEQRGRIAEARRADTAEQRAESAQAQAEQERDARLALEAELRRLRGR